MPFTVLLTSDATRDLEELYEYISLHDAPEKANYVLDKIESKQQRQDQNVYADEYGGPALRGRV